MKMANKIQESNSTTDKIVAYKELINEMIQYINHIREFTEYFLNQNVDQGTTDDSDGFDDGLSNFDTFGNFDDENAKVSDDMIHKDKTTISKQDHQSFEAGILDMWNDMNDGDTTNDMGLSESNDDNFEVVSRSANKKGKEDKTIDDIEYELKRLLEQDDIDGDVEDNNDNVEVTGQIDKDKDIKSEIYEQGHDGMDNMDNMSDAKDDGDDGDNEDNGDNTESDMDKNIELKDTASKNAKISKLDQLRQRMDTILQFFNESMKREYDVLINKYPFLALLEHEEIARFKSYPHDIRKRIVEELDKRAWATREDIINTIVYVLEQVKREEQPFLAYASEQDRKFYYSLDDKEKRIVESLAKIYNVNRYNADAFWQFAKDKLRQELKLKNAVIENTKKIESAKKLHKIYESQSTDANINLLKYMLGLD